MNRLLTALASAAVRNALLTVVEFIFIFASLLLLALATYTYSEFSTYRWDWKQVGPRQFAHPDSPLYWADYEKSVREFKAQFPKDLTERPLTEPNENSEAVRRAFPRGDEPLFRW